MRQVVNKRFICINLFIHLFFYIQAIDGLSKALEHHNISISTAISFRSKEEGEIKSKIKTLIVSY